MSSGDDSDEEQNKGGGSKDGEKAQQDSDEPIGLNMLQEDDLDTIKHSQGTDEKI